jgi:hypothetical protein
VCRVKEHRGADDTGRMAVARTISHSDFISAGSRSAYGIMAQE